MSTEVPSTRYVVDADDTIISVSDSWPVFARANDASESIASRVVGTSLWQFIEGREVQHLFRVVLQRVRENDTPVILPFRCDSPGMRRLMRLIISHQIEGRVQFDALLVREEPRAPIALLGSGPREGRAFLAMCSWCKVVRVAPEVWLEVEDAIVRLGLFRTSLLPAITHSICPRCEKMPQPSSAAPLPS